MPPLRPLRVEHVRVVAYTYSWLPCAADTVMCTGCPFSGHVKCCSGDDVHDSMTRLLVKLELGIMTYEEAHRAIKRGDLVRLRAELESGLTPNLSNRLG